MNIRIFLPAFILALGVAATGCSKSGKLNNASTFVPPAGPMELKLKWTPGERVVQEFNMDQKMIMNLPGQPTPMNQDMNMGQKLSLTVLNADADGGHEIEMQFLNAHMNMQMGQQKMKYDSESDSASGSTNPFAKIFGQLVGARLQYFLDASNNVQRIDGIDELVNRMTAGGPAGVSLKGMFGESYFKQMMGSSQLLPHNGVQPGDTWPVHVEIQIPMLGNMETDYSMFFKGWEMRGKRNCARIEFSGTVSSQPGGEPEPMGMTMTIQDGSTDGVFWFDPEFGMAIESKMNEVTTMVISFSKQKQNGGSPIQSMTNQLTQAIDFKVDSVN